MRNQTGRGPKARHANSEAVSSVQQKPSSDPDRESSVDAPRIPSEHEQRSAEALEASSAGKAQTSVPNSADEEADAALESSSDDEEQDGDELENDEGDEADDEPDSDEEEQDAEENEAAGAPRRLTDILRALGETELSRLIQRLKIKIDSAKRIDVPSQVARALIAMSDARDPSRLPVASCELLQRIAEAGGVLVVPSVPMGLDTLMGRGLVYARKDENGIELVLPTAFLLMLPTWEGEDPRAFRALLARAPIEAITGIASHYAGRPATPPVVLSLEAAYEAIMDAERLRAALGHLSPAERRLLDAVESVGGEVDTVELLDLEREPMRLRGASGVAASRRGAGFALERRGFLIPLHPGRHVVPTEVAAVVGEERRRLRESKRANIRSFVVEADHAPRRARFAADPATLAAATAFLARDPNSEVRPGIGTPKSLLIRMAQRLGRDAETISLIAALSRAVGLWDATASTPTMPPGSLTLRELLPLLFTTWCRGGAWDEARPEREVLRLSAEQRDASPIAALRPMVFEALLSLGEGRWIPWSSLSGYLAEDERMSGIERLLRRWAERASVEPVSALEVTRRIALETLPALGVVDLGGEPDEPGVDSTTLRLTPRGRALLSGSAPSLDTAPSRFLDSHVLAVGGGTKVAHLLALATFAELGRVDSELHLLLTVSSISRVLSTGIESESLRSRIEVVAPLPDSISRMLAQASVVVGRVSYVPASGFLWADDPDIREMLRTRRGTSELFIDPSPPGGLLIVPEVDTDKLVRRCRGLGIEIESQGGILKVRSTAPPPPSTTPRGRSRTPTGGKR